MECSGEMRGKYPDLLKLVRYRSRLESIGIDIIIVYFTKKCDLTCQMYNVLV